MSDPQTTCPAASVEVTVRGMVASLGLDARSACAAARAGLVRPGRIGGYLVVSPEDNEEEPLVGHPIGALTAGFDGQGRLARLLEMGLRSLARDTDVTAGIGRLPLYVSLSDPHRELTGLELIHDEADREERRAEAPTEEVAVRARDTYRDAVRRAVEIAFGQTDADIRHVSFVGHAGVGDCLARALRDLDAGVASAAVVGGADSLLGSRTLEWLELTGRLKSPSTPAGLMPGEAAVFFVVERAGPRARVGTTLRISAVASIDDDAPLLGAGIASAAALSALPAALGSSGEPTSTTWLVTDHNGEPYRALEWGNFLTRLNARNTRKADVCAWFPALSFGDTGAASGAVAICVAAHAFERRRNPSARCLILSSSDGPQRSIIETTTAG